MQYNPYLWPNRRNFRVLKEIEVEEHDDDVWFKSGSGNMAVSCMRSASGHNYRNSSVIVDFSAMGEIPVHVPQNVFLVVSNETRDPRLLYIIWQIRHPLLDLCIFGEAHCSGVLFIGDYEGQTSSISLTDDRVIRLINNTAQIPRLFRISTSDDQSLVNKRNAIWSIV